MSTIAQETLTEAFTNAGGTFYFSDLSSGGSELDNPNTAAYVPCFFTGGAGILTQLQGAGNGTLSMYAENDYNTLLASWAVEPTAGLEAYPVFMHVLSLIQSGSNITLGNNYSFTLAISDGFPNQSDVRAGVLYGTNNSLNGTLTIPPVAKVSSGYGYGNNGTEFTGNLTIPGIANVKTSITYGENSALTGNLTLPGVAKVSSGTVYGANSALTGNLTIPGVSKVKSGTAYGENSALTGNLSLPGINQTLNGTLYGENSALTGVLVLPAVGDVRLATLYGANATEYNGTLDPGNGTTTIVRRDSMLEIPFRTPLLSPPPLTLPAATTSLTALLTANSYTFPTGTVTLVLQAQTDYALIDLAGSNASANGSILESNQSIRLNKQANDDTSLGSIHVVRGASGATLKVTCL